VKEPLPPSGSGPGGAPDPGLDPEVAELARRLSASDDPLARLLRPVPPDAAQRIVTLQTEDGFSVCFAVPREQQSPLAEALMAQPKSSSILRMN